MSLLEGICIILVGVAGLCAILEGFYRLWLVWLRWR